MPENRRNREESPHWSNGRFRNETPWEWMSAKDYAGMMYDFVFKGGERSPHAKLPSVTPDLSHFTSTEDDQLNATWLGHSTVLLNVDGVRILTDPVFVKGITPLGPWRYSGRMPLSMLDVPGTDIVIVSHNHFDHLNERSIRSIKDKVGAFVTPLGVGDDLAASGVERQKIVELDWWQQYESPTGLVLTATPSQHFSGRGLMDRDKTLWASFVIEGPHHHIFFGGDSGYFDGFKRIGEKFGPFDMAFVETGAYSRYWRAVHMFPEEAVQAHRDLKGKILHPIHWGTFNLSLHTWYDPMRRLMKEAKRLGVRTATPVAGETTIYPGNIPDKEWWEEVIGRRG